MSFVWVAPGAIKDGQGVAAITPNPAAAAAGVTISGSVPILEGSVVTPHGSHTGTITIDPSTCAKATVTIAGLRVAIATTTATCGGGIDPGPPPKTLSPTVSII